MTSNRRDFIRKAPAVAAVAAVPAVAAAQPAAAEGRPRHRPEKEVHFPGAEPPENPLMSPVVTYGGLVFLSGIGAHFEGDVRAHTAHVLDELERNLEAVGSSMANVLKVNVYLGDLADYDAMNEVYLGRFGPEPAARTTIAAKGGIPGDSLVEIDCVAVR
ncbi:RidA family protein [Streptomyces sp. NPDC048172]|uniref:RidA family protein n=1 Tax=Streptomyces sp. NPDC048172 TaxID=3365505 RepID=UPI00371B93F6